MTHTFFFISNGHVNTRPLRHKEKIKWIKKVDVEKSIKRKECPEHAINGRIEKNQAMQDSDEDGLRPFPLAGCRAYRKLFSKLNSIEMFTKAVVSSCQAKFSKSSAPRPLWDTLESFPPDLFGISLGILILGEVLYLFLDEKLNVDKNNSCSWCL